VAEVEVITFINLIFKGLLNLVFHHKDLSKSIMLYTQLGVFIYFTTVLIRSANYESNVLEKVLVMLRPINRGLRSPAEMTQYIEQAIIENKGVKSWIARKWETNLTELWDHYKKRVSELDPDERINVNPLLGVEILYAKLGRRVILDHVGGTLIAIGILFTFIGLASGVSHLHFGDSLSVSQNKVNELLENLGVAFSTSIFGVFLSVIWTFIDKSKMRVFEEKVFELAEKFDYLLSVDEEEVFLNRMEKIAKEQKESIRTAMLDALDAPVFHSMSQHMEKQTDLIQKQLDNSAGMAGTIIESTTGGMRDALKTYVSGMETIQQSQATFASALQNLSGYFEQTLSNNQATVDKTENMLKVFDNMASEMDGMRAMYQSTARIFEQLGSSLSVIQAQTAEQLPQQEKIFQSVSTMSKDFTEAVSGLAQTRDEMGKLFDEKFESLMKHSDEMFQQFTQMTNKVHAIVSSQEKSLENSNKLVGEIAQVSEKINPLASAFERISETIKALEQQFTATNHTQQELTKALSDSRLQTDELTKKALETSKAHLEQISSQIKDLAERNLQMQQHWKSTEQSFSETNSSVRDGLREFKDDIENVLVKTFELYDAELSKAVDKISAQISFFNELSSDMVDAADEINELKDKLTRGLK
jgi:uncharacterized protein YoxC